MGRRVAISALAGIILLTAGCGGGQCLRIPPAAITGDNSGGAIAVYEIQQMSDSYVQFYAQRISPEGDFLWGETGILVGSGYAGGGLFDSYAVSDGLGGAIVIWLTDLPQAEGELPSFQIAKIDSEGNVKWRRDIPGADRAIPDSSGGVIIAFDDSYGNISVLKVDAEGNLPWGEDGLSLNLPDAYLCSIASDNSGGVIVAQAIYGEDIICAQKVDSQGNILWQTGGVQVSAGPAEGPQVVSDGAGGAIITYILNTPSEDAIGYIDSDIYVQRIDADGDILWGPDGVPISTGPSWPFDPGLVDDGAGGAIIFFVDERGVCARRIDADGHKLWPEDVELWPTTYHSLVSDGFSGAISVQYGGEGIKAGAHRLDGMGRKMWGSGGTTLTFQDLSLPLAVPDGYGGALISWSAVNFTSDEVSYYIQRVDAEGNLPWGDEGILLNP